MSKSESNEERSVHRPRWIGYGLLLFALIDSIQILIPPNFMNPAWELQTIGALVERVPVPLLGLVLIFSGEYYDRKALEEILLKVLSWLSLVLAVLFLLMVPLGMVDTLRLNTQNNQEISKLATQQLSQLQQIQEQVNQSQPEDLSRLATQLNQSGVPVDPQKPEGLKSEILSRIAAKRAQVQSETQATQANQRLVLLKNSVKWNLGALISSVLFFILWKTTPWAR